MALRPDDALRGKLQRGSLRQVKPRGETLDFQYNPETVVETPAVGGWERLSRPRRATALNWLGSPERSVTMTLRLDGFPDTSIERDIRILEAMGEPRSKRKPPPQLRLIYGGQFKNALWVIDALDYSDELRNRRLDRVFVEATITLVEYVGVDVTLTAAERRKKKKR